MCGSRFDGFFCLVYSGGGGGMFSVSLGVFYCDLVILGGGGFFFVVF